MGEKKARWNAGCKAKIVYDSKYVELHRKENCESVIAIERERSNDSQTDDLKHTK